MFISGNFEARVRHQETRNSIKTRMDVLADQLQLLVLSISYLQSPYIQHANLKITYVVLKVEDSCKKLRTTLHGSFNIHIEWALPRTQVTSSLKFLYILQQFSLHKNNLEI